MASSTQFLKALLAAGVRINPAVYDVIFPHGPARFVLHEAGRHVRGGDVDRVALNPQPLPPGELEIGAGLFAEVLRSAIAAAGTEGPDAVAKLVSFDIDDWCGTGWPRKWPKPRPKLDPREILLGASLAAVTLAAGYEGPVAEALEAGAERLADAAIG